MSHYALPASATIEQIFSIAKTHPFYQDTLAGVDSFTECPLADRQMLVDCIDRNLNTPAFLTGVYVSPSGGSQSGKPGFIVTDIRENEHQRRILARHLIAASIVKSETVALNLMPNTFMYKASEIFTDLCERAKATVLAVGENTPPQQMCQVAARFGTNTVIAMPGTLFQLAEFVSRNDLPISFDNLIFAGESISNERRSFFQNVLKIRNISGVYGSAEAGVWAFQPSDLPANCYLIAPEIVHAEIVNADQDGFGKLVVTNLIRRRNPLLRYDTGDIARLTTVTYRGKVWNALEHKQRTTTSVRIGGEILAVPEQLNGCSHFQMSLSFDSLKQKDKLTFYLVPEASCHQSKIDEVIESLSSILRSDTFLIETRVVNYDTLIKSPTSQKVVKLLDLRKENA